MASSLGCGVNWPRWGGRGSFRRRFFGSRGELLLVPVVVPSWWKEAHRSRQRLASKQSPDWRLP